MVRRLCGQVWGGPSGVADQSRARISGAISPLPENSSSPRLARMHESWTKTQSAGSGRSIARARERRPAALALERRARSVTRGVVNPAGGTLRRLRRIDDVILEALVCGTAEIAFAGRVGGPRRLCPEQRRATRRARRRADQGVLVKLHGQSGERQTLRRWPLDWTEDMIHARARRSPSRRQPCCLLGRTSISSPMHDASAGAARRVPVQNLNGSRSAVGRGKRGRESFLTKMRKDSRPLFSW